MTIKNKIVLLGDSGTGKTTFINNYVGIKSLNIGPTIGASCICKKIFQNGKEFKFTFWDTAGQERFRSILPIYYRDAAGCLLFFDLTNMNSFKNIIYWIDNVKEHNSNVKILLICNKNDIDDKSWKVSFVDIVDISIRYDIDYLFASSYKIDDVACHIDNFIMDVYKIPEKNTNIQLELDDYNIDTNTSFFDKLLLKC